MARPVLIHFLAATALLVGSVTAQRNVTSGDAVSACAEIQTLTSDGPANVLHSADEGFIGDIRHWFFVRSSEIPTCVVQVTSPEDVSTVMKTVGKYRAPWGVKSGGHASNPGFSSTTGVHISMYKFNQVIMSSDNSTVEIGFGLTWAEVYQKLDGSGFSVNGGRTYGPGVGGFTLGGGYSWTTNQYGLTSDTVTLYNLVLPNGTITTASADNNPDLFWALKGGLNKFGVVTSAVFKTQPITPQIYGGLRVYGPETTQQVLNATAQFAAINNDPKAQIITSIGAVGLNSTHGVLITMFYDGPDPGTNFAMFDGIPATLDLVFKQPFANLVGTLNSNIATSPRGAFDVLPTTKITLGFMNAINNQSELIQQVGGEHGGILMLWDVEPFLDYGKHAVDSAFPHSDSASPLNIYYSWVSEAEDDFWISTISSLKQDLIQVAIKEGIYNESIALYPNYAGPGATPEQMYGVEGAARMRSIYKSMDTDGIGGLAGGYALVQ